MTGTEIIDPSFKNKQEARTTVRLALDHFNTAKQATVQVMADLSLLQDREANLVYGETNFAAWVEHTFDGIGESSVKQLTRCGRVARHLDAAGKINLKKSPVDGDYVGVGTRGLRELASIHGELGVDTMLRVYDQAAELVEDKRDISDLTVKAAMRLLVSGSTDEQATDLDVSDALDDPDDVGDGDEDDTLDTDPARPTLIAELVETINDLSWDLPESRDEMIDAIKQLQAELEGRSPDQDQLWIDSSR